MKIEKTLNIPAEFFYDKVIDSVIFDVRQATGKDLTRKQLKNFEYVKTFSKNSRAKIKIDEVVENQTYQFKTSTTKNDFVARYDIEPLTDSSCKVSYTETMKSFGFMQQMNDMVLGIVVGMFKRRHFKKMLTMIEQSY
ncbi:DUF3284 domain-containing protein [Enterococcus asini]|uniref:DUF3284 domain-containing protein n=1 Tax=Enterococcus asini TaxID=57732 RepID=UPI00241E4000|nr:DUF3284 domain-containing protein [Enterococcus asini]